MRYAYLPILLLSLVAGCLDLGDESTNQSVAGPGLATVVHPDRIGSNRIGSNRIGSNRIGSNRIAAARLTDNRLANGKLQVNTNTSQQLLSTDDGREVFALIVSCALPQDVNLTATVDGIDFEFDGADGLAPQWLFAPLDPVGQRFVSACMFALVNGHDVAVPVSMRGPHPQLAAGFDERAEFPVEEGAFFGNAFGPLDQPIQWFACRGRDLAAATTVTGGLADRGCAQPDPANPGMTLCGFFFAGDCGNFARVHSCDAFDPIGTFYLGCHTAPFAVIPPLGDREFAEVITTFVTP